MLQYYVEEVPQCWESLPNEPVIFLSIKINADGIFGFQEEVKLKNILHFKVFDVNWRYWYKYSASMICIVLMFINKSIDKEKEVSRLKNNNKYIYAGKHEKLETKNS